MLQAPHPELDDLLEMMGEAGRRLSDIEAYEYLNLFAGEIGEGLSADEARAICKTFNVQQNIF
jgi:hypothetical protein